MIQDKTRHTTGDQGRDRHTGHAQSQHIDTQSITADVNDIFHHGDLQRDLGISHGAEQRRTGIVQGKEREGQCRDHHVNYSIVEYIRFNLTEKQGNDAVTEHHDQNRNTDGNAYGGHDQLFCGFAGVLFFPCSEELGSHHRATGSQCRQHTDDQVIEHVDQGYAGDRRLARRRDHDGIRHAHSDCQCLFK